MSGEGPRKTREKQTRKKKKQHWAHSTTVRKSVPNVKKSAINFYFLSLVALNLFTIRWRPRELICVCRAAAPCEQTSSSVSCLKDVFKKSPRKNFSLSNRAVTRHRLSRGDITRQLSVETDRLSLRVGRRFVAVDRRPANKLWHHWGFFSLCFFCVAFFVEFPRLAKGIF